MHECVDGLAGSLVGMVAAAAFLERQDVVGCMGTRGEAYESRWAVRTCHLPKVTLSQGACPKILSVP